MSTIDLLVREMQAVDIPRIVDYFVEADEAYLRGMGVDKRKLPPREDWITLLQDELAKPYTEKTYYYIVWLMDQQPVGHSNIDSIIFGESAKMHLHLWNTGSRHRGLGPAFLRKTIPYYFRNFKLGTLICEPLADNPAPNRVLRKLGFVLTTTYDTQPGRINFHRTANRYELTAEAFDIAKATWNIPTVP